MNASLYTLPHVAGALLTLGAVLVGVAASVATLVKDPKGPVIWGQPPGEWLRLISVYPGRWRWGAALWIAGMVVTLAGLALLTQLFHVAGDPGFASVGLLLFALGAALWTICLSFRASVEIWAARAMAATNAIPDAYTALSVWSGGLFQVFTAVAFVAMAAFGAAALVTDPLPHWAGWLTIIVSLGGLTHQALTRDSYPVLHHAAPLILGVLLMLS